MLLKLSKHTECNYVIVIKYTKKLKCLSPFLTTALLTIYKPEKPSKGSNKIYQLLQWFHMIAILKNTSKYDISDSKEGTYSGAPLPQTWML